MIDVKVSYVNLNKYKIMNGIFGIVSLRTSWAYLSNKYAKHN